MVKNKMNKTINKYLPAESTTSFCFAELIIKIKREVKGSFNLLTKDQKKEQYPQMTEDQIKSRSMPEDILHELMLRSLKRFTINDQTFDYRSFKNNLGGFRWFVLCPKCGSYSLKLYLPNKFKERDQRYLCKSCHNLKNASSLLGATKRYKVVIRPIKRLEIIKSILLKKNMNSEKAKPLLEEYEKIERELKDAPEYKLWKFQEKFNKNIT